MSRLLPIVPHEVIAQARARLSRAGFDARPVYVVRSNRDYGQVEFLTSDGMIWPVVLRLEEKGVVAEPVEADSTLAASSLDEALDQLTNLLAAATPRLLDPDAVV